MYEKLLRIIWLIYVLTFFFSCNPPDKFNKTLIRIVKDNSIYSDSLNWHEIEISLDSISGNSEVDNQNSKKVNFLIKKLKAAGDNHSLYFSSEKMNELKNKNLWSLLPETKKIDNDIAYIKIPGFMSVNNDTCNDFATKLQMLIKSLDSDSVIGWIVDLRENYGGNMYPMIVGLGPLTGEGVLGNFIYKNGERLAWKYINGTMGDVKVANPYYLRNKNVKIAVLVSQKTASSGEITAISFMGKKNTKLFGQNTAGYLTSNRGFELPDSSYIFLASSYTTDRNNRLYKTQIIPDIIVNDLNRQTAIDLAINWLREK